MKNLHLRTLNHKIGIHLSVDGDKAFGVEIGWLPLLAIPDLNVTVNGVASLNTGSPKTSDTYTWIFGFTFEMR